MNAIKIYQITEKTVGKTKMYPLFFLQSNESTDNNGSERAIRNIHVRQKYQVNLKHWVLLIFLPSLGLLLKPLSKMEIYLLSLLSNYYPSQFAESTINSRL